MTAMQKKFEINKRTFEALNHPKNSEQRILLNQHSKTSEYMPSYKWNVCCFYDDGRLLSSRSFKTKKEAISNIKDWIRYVH